MVNQPRPGRPEPDEYTARLLAIRQLLATQGAAEEVVLASEDPTVTPARLVIGEHGPTVDMGDGVRLSLAGVGEEEGLDADALVDAQKRGLLGLIRRPELAFRAAYRHSELRRVLRRMFPRLRQYEDNISIAAMLEEAYGAPGGLRHRLRRFVRRNVLLTLSLCAAVLAGGQIGASSLLDVAFAPPAAVEDRTAEGPEEAADAADSPAMPVAEPEPAPPPEPAEVLAHCAVTPHARTLYAAADESARRELLRELHRFQVRLEAAGVDAAWQHARARHAALSVAALPALDAVTDALEGYRADRSRGLAELAALETAYRESRDPARMREVDAVNRSIRLRDELAALESQLRDSPGDNALRVVEERVAGLRERLLVDAERLATGPEGAQGPEIAAALERDLVIPAREITGASPTLARVRLSGVAEALAALERSIADAYGELRAALDRVAVEEESANRRFASLAANGDERALIGASGCLENIQLALGRN